jgi:hypothetical protein
VYNVEKGIEARWGKYVDGAKYCGELEQDKTVTLKIVAVAQPNAITAG